ncbi:DEAD/DEAH box helicase [Acinetobacter higginsii]|uniref:DEAD/DEAH box helicase n=1 Tax=Acinetobacter higginsii TaxID=70347 RepID=UPI001F4B7B35|nr:DEAD/DEAH box helicase [Acinetobacter higginsii]MCH7294434.1 DEAD/DEAH box helicase [Acinetobacter higginsii]
MNLIEKIKTLDEFDFNETFSIYNECSKALLEKQDHGIEILINILNYRKKFNQDLNEILSDLVESIGFYPYIKKENLYPSSTSANIRIGVNESNNIKDKYFHDEQKYILDLLNSGKNIILSAPTSFGKSLLIEELVASKKYRNIVIIQPTLALLDETRKKLSKYKLHYKLILRTSQEPDFKKGNIFLLTAERVNEYQNLPYIDFLIIDEFYKLSSKRDDERSDSLNNAFQYLINKYSPQFYLLGPNVEGISTGFEEKYNALFYKTNYNLVDYNEIDIYKENQNNFGDRGAKKEFKEKVLFQLLLSLKDEQTIIYCSSPARARYLSTAYLKYLNESNIYTQAKDLPIIEWIKKYIDERWSLIDCLNNGIGVHDGALQKHITSTIIDYFNKGVLNTLFCTATIIEGVNTTAKNVIFFDKNKGNLTPVDFFDYSNIKGRAGRLMEHYIGNIYNFNPPPIQKQFYVDIPFFEQNPISDEVLINITPENVLNKNSDQYNLISKIPKNEKDLYSHNSLYIKGQIDLLNRLRIDITNNYNLIAWDGTPKYEQLEYCLGLAWDYLVKPNENLNPMTKKRIVKLTFDYGLNKNINNLIYNIYYYNKNKNKTKTDQQILDEAIRDSFHTLRHWFQYKIPKWLLVLNEMQSFVCNEKGIRAGNYKFYASSIEFDFIHDNMIILMEYGIPKSAIDKIQKYIPQNLDQEKVLNEIISKKIYLKPDFIEYERLKILENR